MADGFVGGIYTLSGPAADWLARAPRSLPQLEARLRRVLRPVEKVTQTAEQVEELTNPNDGTVPVVQVKEPGLGAALFPYPLVMGRQFTLNAVVLFVALTFWWWAWGIPGALLAVPLMAILKDLQREDRRPGASGEAARGVVTRFAFSTRGDHSHVHGSW